MSGVWFDLGENGPRGGPKTAKVKRSCVRSGAPDAAIAVISGAGDPPLWMPAGPGRVADRGSGGDRCWESRDSGPGNRDSDDMDLQGDRSGVDAGQLPSGVNTEVECTLSGRR